MKKINILETFSGIGAQKKAIDILEKDKEDKLFSIVATVEWDARANISYAAIHHNLLGKYREIIKECSLNDERNLNQFLSQYTFSLNSKNYSKLQGKSIYFKELLAASLILSNNKVDINQVNGSLIDQLKVNLVTYSFPCQGLSVANMGRAQGIENTDSTSSLIWQIERILNECQNKPKYLLMENVPNLLSAKFINQYEKWKEVLNQLGYDTYTTIINGIDAGSIQKRRRVFALSIRKGTKLPFCDDVTFDQYLRAIYEPNKLDEKGRRIAFNDIFHFKNSSYNDQFIINKTPSRQRMVVESKNITESTNYIVSTLTTKQDRIPNSGIITYQNNFIDKLNYRFISPREAFQLMGFTRLDFEPLNKLIKRKILTLESVYRQAGNSIVVESIINIFRLIKKIERKK